MRGRTEVRRGCGKDCRDRAATLEAPEVPPVKEEVASPLSCPGHGPYTRRAWHGKQAVSILAGDVVQAPDTLFRSHSFRCLHHSVQSHRSLVTGDQIRDAGCLLQGTRQKPSSGESHPVSASATTRPELLPSFYFSGGWGWGLELGRRDHAEGRNRVRRLGWGRGRLHLLLPPERGWPDRTAPPLCPPSP